MKTKRILSACAGLLATGVAMSQPVVPNDPQFSQQWALAAIGATNAWATSTGSSNVVVAVISTGIRYDHEDLVANMWRNPGEIPGNGTDDDNNGYVDDVHGIDLVDGDSDPMDVGWGGYNYQGTLAAGVVGAAGNNGTGVIGINWTVNLMAIRLVSLGGGGVPENQIEKLNYALQMKQRGVNIRVICFVVSSSTYRQNVKDLLEALGKLGVVVVAPTFSGGDSDLSPVYPACYRLDNVISVAGCNASGDLVSRSGWGRTNIHLAAPSALVRSTSGRNASDYETLDASAVTPGVAHVAGAAALLISAWPDATPAQIKTALLESLDLLPALTNKVASHGRLNVGRAMNRLTAVMTSTRSLPPLTIARAGSSVVLTWPASAAPAILERISSLSVGQQTWTVVPGLPEPNGLNLTITVPVWDRAFFRLRQP